MNISIAELKELIKDIPDNYMFAVGTRNTKGMVTAKPEFSGTSYSSPELKIFVLFQKDSFK